MKLRILHDIARTQVVIFWNQKMQMFHILPENERNNFLNHREQLDFRIRRIESRVEALKPMNDHMLGNLGREILMLLQDVKFTMTVKTFLAIAKRRLKETTTTMIFMIGPIPGTTEKAEKIAEDFLVVTIKSLANDGFIKLSNAQEFEAREIVKYHATAKPKFRCGKFQLWKNSAQKTALFRATSSICWFWTSFI